MPRLKLMVEREDGWCDWQFPVMERYRMACCDCGLVHDVQFKIVRTTKPDKTGYYTVIREMNGLKVMMRAKRNNRSTAGTRRRKSTK